MTQTLNVEVIVALFFFLRFQWKIYVEVDILGARKLRESTNDVFVAAVSTPYK